MKLPFKTQPPEDLSTQIKLLSAALDEADCIIAGAGAGLSTSAGFLYSGERFRKYFSDFEEKYNFHDMYSSGFYPYDTLEEYWAFWSRYIWINRYMNPPKPVYEKLHTILKGKDYFVLTTNVDHCFQKAGTASFIRRATMASSSAAAPASLSPMTMRKSSAKWCFPRASRFWKTIPCCLPLLPK